MRLQNQEEKTSTRRLSVKSILGCDNKQVKKSTQIVFALATGFLFTMLLTTVIMQAIILDIDLDKEDSGQVSESSSDDNFSSDSEKCITRGCHVFCVNLSLTRLIEISIKSAVKELKTCMNISLVLQFVNFDKNMLPNYWLRDLSKPVTSIQIIGGNLQYISPDAFRSDTFTYLQLIFINALTIIRLDEQSFSGVRNLQQLTITQIQSLQLTTNTFQLLETSLITLSIENCGSWDPRVFCSPTLSNLRDVYFRFNDFKSKHLDKISLRGVKSTEILNLASSNIVSLQDGTFDEFENLLYINLNDNNLHTLPSHIFDHLVSSNMRVTLDLHMNPWHCDCRLDFLRKLALENFTLTIPICSTPMLFAGRSFDSIESFCDDDEFEHHVGFYGNALSSDRNISMPSSCTVTTNIQTLNDINQYNKITYQNVTNISTEFCIVDERQSSIRINFTGDLNRNYNLFWFPLISGSSIPDTVSCIPRVTGTVVLEVLQHGAYLFCLLNENETVIKSSHCKIHIRPVHGISLSRLTTSQKTIVIFIFALSILSCLLLTGCSIWLAVRSNSAILGTNKNVIKVKRRADQSYIIPTKLHKIIPMELKDVGRDRKSSKISTASYKSGTTYISTVDTTESLSTSWRVKSASRSSQPKFTSVYVINKEEQSAGRSTLSRDYPKELESGVRKGRSAEVTTVPNV